MNIAKKYIILILTLLPFLGYSQQIFYQDIFYGGVTGGGFSTGVGDGGSGQIVVNIDPTSTIRKAYLLCTRYREAQPINVTLNSNSYNFNNTHQVGSDFDLSECSSYSAIHAIDITNDINPLINTYNISIPNQITNLFDKYGAFYLVILYENLTLPKIAVSLIFNEKDVAPNVNYQIKNLLPIDTLNPVGLAIHSDILWDTPNDGSYTYVNGNNLGLIQGSDNVNSIWNGAGVKGHFYYENNMLFGLDDDTPDSLMQGTDGLADIKSYVQNNTTNLNVNMVYENNITSCNIYLAFFLTYTTPCDTFTTTAITLQDTICLGDSVQLNAAGGSQYSWFGAFGGVSDTSIANPMASPPQTTTYIVTIKNDSGCVKTEHVKIWVTQPIDSITTTPTICGNATGSITAHFNTNANYSFMLYDNNFNPLANNTTGVFNQLAEGTYIVENILHNCAFYDTVTVNAINNVQAAFIRNPTQGKAPLTVTLTNISNNANQFIWLLPNDTFYSQHLTYTFTNGGSYPVCLVAYNNQLHCADTTCFTFVVEGNVGLIIPNIFTPNNDGHNDVFSIQIIDAELISTIEVIIYNRWGEKMYEYINNESTPELLLWNGVTSSGNKASEGTYFYVINYTTKAGETIIEKGTVSLLR